MESLHCGVGVVALQRALEIHGEALRAGHGVTVNSCASRVGRTVGAISADRHHPHLGQTGDFESGSGSEFLGSPTFSASRNGHSGFSTSHYATGPLQWVALAHNTPRHGTKPLPRFSGLPGQGQRMHEGSKPCLPGCAGDSRDGRCVVPDDVMMDSTRQGGARLRSLPRKSLTSTVEMLTHTVEGPPARCDSVSESRRRLDRSWGLGLSVLTQ